MVERIVIGVAAWLMGFSVGALAGYLLAWRYMEQEVLVARRGAERERTRADNALDQLALQIRGEPISVAGVAARESTLERSLKQDDELREMFLDETDEGGPEPPHAA